MDFIQDFVFLYMAKIENTFLDFQIDKLTNSIENIVTGDSFETEVSIVTKQDLNKISHKTGWLFDWKKEFMQPDRDIYKLSITSSPGIIQGIVSLTVKEDHVIMNLIESAPFNKGKNKVYLGVPGNLVAYACKLSFQRGCQGYLSFIAKTQLIEHYIRTLNAVHVGGQRMVINTTAALILINKYFPKK